MLGRRARLVFAVGSLAALLAAAGCAPEIGMGEQEIVNGQVSTPGAHPSTVYLSFGSGSCSGTLVSPRVVLTARHCLEGYAVEDMEVFFGNDVEGDGTWVRVEGYEYHSTVDIGVLTLTQPAPSPWVQINQRTLSTADIGKSVLLVGFGDVDGSGGVGVKREGETSIEDVDDDAIYVGSTGSKTCYGDSGGPTFVEWGDGVEYVAGVTWRITNEDCTLGQSVNVRTDRYYDWIMEYIDAHDPAGCHEDGRCGSMCTSVDPDCPCAPDGFCTTECADYLTEDPDCAGCGVGDVCRTNCPELDTDCCVEDGVCDVACDVLDPDCLPPGEDPPDDDPPADPGDDPVAGGCSSGGPSGGIPGVLLAALLLVATRRSSTRQRRG